MSVINELEEGELGPLQLHMELKASLGSMRPFLQKIKSVVTGEMNSS